MSFFLSLRVPRILPLTKSLSEEQPVQLTRSLVFSPSKQHFLSLLTAVYSWSLTVVSIPPNTILERRKQAQTGEAICPRVQLINYSVSFRPEPL